MEERAKRKLTSILSADVKGYSPLMGGDELATVETLKKYCDVISSLVGDYGGRVVDSPGDNLLAEFVSVVDAVECGVKIQGVLKDENAQLSENRSMEFRIGINLGDVIDDEGRIHGDGVNVAARVESLAEGGGICISGTAFDQIGKKLPLGYEYMGEQDVKNIEKPIRVYKVLTEPEYAGNVIGEERPKSRQWRWAAIAIILIIVAGALALWNSYFRPPPIEPASVARMAFPLPDKPSIAVLSFTNMSEDPKQEYFSDGITEDIITALSKTTKMFVIARTSSFKYKGKEVDVRTVGRELGVRYVLEGSVRKAGDKVRITAQLIDAKTNKHLWAERYDRDLQDIFAIQDEIKMNIITALRVQLTEGEQAAFSIKSQTNLDAYLRYLEAREYAADFSRDTNIKARKAAEEAIALDPSFQGGYSVLAQVEFFDVWLGLSESPKDSLRRAIKLAKKAIAIEDSPEPHRTLAGVYILLRKLDEAIAEGKKAIELDPNSANAHGTLGHVLMMADMPQEAVLILNKAIRLNPYPPSRYFHDLADAYNRLGKHEEAITAGKKAVRIQPKDFIAHLSLVSGYSLLGREEEARAQVAEMLRINPKFCIPRVIGGSFKTPEVIERSIKIWHKAGVSDCPPRQKS